MSLSSLDKSFHAPESHLMCLRIPEGSDAAERRCTLYCAAISHISLCPWPPQSISNSPMPAPRWSGVPCESLASSPVDAAEESHLIEQGLPWEELGDAGLIYYTHTSRGHQRKGILLTPGITSRLSFSFAPSFSSLTHA